MHCVRTPEMHVCAIFTYKNSHYSGEMNAVETCPEDYKVFLLPAQCND